MFELLPIFMVSLVLGALAQYNSVYDLNTEQYIRKDKIFFVFLALILSVFAGLRTNYNDTTAYTHGYEMISEKGSIVDGINWLEIANNPGFNFVNNILKHSGVSTQSFLMFYAVITICIYVWFIRKYTENIWMSVFLFSAMGVYTFAFAAIKQCAAVAFCLVATDRAIQKKWIRFVFWILVATVFHPYSLMYLLVPLLMFKPWTTRGYLVLGIAAVIGLSLEGLMGTIVDITTMMGKEYSSTSFSGEGVNIFRFMVACVPLVLSFMGRKYIYYKDNRTMNLMINLSLLNAEIMFIALFGTANYFARLANYFLIFQVIALPWLFNCFNRESKSFLRTMSVLCYLIYFGYANGVLYGGFDALYNGISIFEYLQTVFN